MVLIAEKFYRPQGKGSAFQKAKKVEERDYIDIYKMIP
jgi:hypothetical protein